MATLSINLENVNGPVLAGENIQGCVALDVKSVISGREIEIFLTGEEKTVVSYEEGTGDDRKSHTARQTKSFLHIAIPLDGGFVIKNGQISPGRYRLPFEVNLPSTLPSSLKKALGLSKCEIVYSISVRVPGSGFIFDYHAAAEFQVISRPLPMVPTPFNGEPVTEKVNVCCCLNRGSATLVVRLDDTILGKSESTKVYIAAQNNSTVRIHRAYAELKEYIRWQARSHNKLTSQSLGIVEYPHFPQLEARRPNEFMGRFDEVDIAKDIQRCANSVVLTVPVTANESFKGELLECRHTICICLEPSRCVSNLTEEIPVQIVGAR